MCHTSIYNLNFIQLVSLAQAAYITKNDDIIKAKNIYYKNTIFKDPDIIIKKMDFITQKNDNIVVLRIDFEFTNSNRNLIVFSIRGSTSFRDWWLDLEMYSPSAIFTLIKSIPFIVKDESLASSCLKFFLTFPLRMMEDITLIRSYSTKIYNLVDNIIDENKNNTDFIFVGHSLGGGLSKYVATHYKMQSFSVSGPGITPLEYKHQTIFGYNKFFKSSFIDIIPDLDIVPRLEISGGIKYRVLCNKNTITCHSIDRTLCMMGIMCHQEQYTKKLCLSMPNIGENEYSQMKNLKNGNQFCDNYILGNEKEKDKCKSAEIT
jgi:lipase ATG15